MKLILRIRKRRKDIYDVDEEYSISDRTLSSLAITEVEESGGILKNGIHKEDPVFDTQSPTGNFRKSSVENRIGQVKKLYV